MLHLSIKSDVDRAVAGLGDAARRQVPFAVARALTDLAFQVQRAERAAIGTTFRHPRPYTQRSVMVRKATKGAPVAEVYVKPEVAAYIAPYEYGGAHHVPGRGRAIINPKATKLDAYGQIAGRPRNIGDKPGVFAGLVQTKTGPVWGFWQRLLVSKMLNPGVKVQRLRLLARAGSALPVHARLGFRTRAQQLVAKQGAAAMRDAIAQALATAKR